MANGRDTDWLSEGSAVMPSDVSVADLVRAAGVELETILRRRRRVAATRVHEAASSLETIFGRQLEQIEAQARQRVALGAPASLRELTGISQLEVPMNRVFGWVFDPARRGSAALVALTQLAQFLDFEVLLRDIQSGETPEVWVESSPDLWLSSRQPDLIVGTSGAALLVENKVDSPESGEGQYADYLALLDDWAESRDARAFLFSRRKRTPPVDWAGSFSHQELGQCVFKQLAEREGLPFWDRVVYGLLAGDLDPDISAETPSEIADVLASRQGPVIRATRLSRLMQRPSIDIRQGGKDVG